MTIGKTSSPLLRTDATLFSDVVAIGYVKEQYLPKGVHPLPLKKMAKSQAIKDFVTCKFYGDADLVKDISKVLADHGIEIFKHEGSNGYVTKTGYHGTATTIKYKRTDGGDS